LHILEKSFDVYLDNQAPASAYETFFLKDLGKEYNRLAFLIENSSIKKAVTYIFIYVTAFCKQENLFTEKGLYL